MYLNPEFHNFKEIKIQFEFKLFHFSNVWFRKSNFNLLHFNCIVYIDYFNYHQIQRKYFNIKQYLIIHKHQLAIFLNQFCLDLFWTKFLKKNPTKVYLNCHWLRLFLLISTLIILDDIRKGYF